jgi:hypothetical protein
VTNRIERVSTISEAHRKSLYSLQRDLDLNKTDADFSRADGKIVYFLDANVGKSISGDFGGFLRRARVAAARESASTGYGTLSDIRGILMMLATEYIFSETLVGRRGSRLYVTSWHREEIANNLVRIHASCMKNLISEGGRAACVEKQTRSILRIVSKGSHESNESSRKVPGARQTILELIKERIDKDEFLQLATELADDMLSEPLDQIDRLLKGALVYDDAATWELAQRHLTRKPPPWAGIANYHDDAKSQVVSEDDAKSISYMQWLADHCMGSAERLVFITNDMRLAQWYDEWFSDDARPSGYRPSNYIVRMLSQYFPQLNLRDARDMTLAQGGDKSGRLFEEIRNNVELILLPDAISPPVVDGSNADATSDIDSALRKLAEIERHSELP